jgi:hypothetical protein
VGARALLAFSRPRAKKRAAWCGPSVDVEAKLEVRGSLTLGVFVTEDKVSEEGAKRMLEDIKKMLMSLKQDRLCFRVAILGDRKHFTTIS